MPIRLGTLTAALLLAAGTAGCGGAAADGSPLVPVAGAVTLKGQPVADGTIVFVPNAARGNQGDASGYEPTGTIKDGKYDLYTKKRLGAPTGTYKVVVRVNAPPDPKEPYAVPKSLIGTQYSTAAMTPLGAEVKADAKPGAYDFGVLP